MVERAGKEQNLKVDISLHLNELIAAGVDAGAVADNVKAETDKLAKELQISVQRIDHPAPEGAQGDLEAIQWLLDWALDPERANFYARALIYAINEILNASLSDKNKDDEASEQSLVKLSFWGKELLLPATTHVIQKFLESLGDS